MSKILITAKIVPDLDGVACTYAYTQLLNFIDKDNEYIAGIFGKPQIEAEFLLKKLNIDNFLFFDPKITFNKFILVDASDTKGMPECLRPQDVIEVIDHRETHKAGEIFSKANINIELVGAAATLIFEKFQEKEININFNSAILLYCAIFSNTFNLQTNVNIRDKKAVADLESEFDIPVGIIDDMFKYKTEYIKNNLEECINNDFKDFNNGLSIAQLEGFNLVDIVNDKLDEIKEILGKLKAKYNLKYIFLTAADLKNNHNIFVVIDEDTKLLLSKALGFSFDERGIAKNNKLILRKQIMPLLMNYL